jgi:hypothetical protein
MTPLECVTQKQIEAIVMKALPLQAESILKNQRKIPDLQPISSLLLLNLVTEEQEAIEKELIEALNDDQAEKKITFIKACVRTMDHETFMFIMRSMCAISRFEIMRTAHLNSFESLWSILNEVQYNGFPDGAIFLQSVKEGFGEVNDETADIFLDYYEIHLHKNASERHNVGI